MDSWHILIVDDEAGVRHVLEQALNRQDYTVHTARDGAEALDKLANTPYDLLLLDLHMEPVGGVQVLNAARRQDPDLVVIILTAYGSVESAVEAIRLGAFDYLFKPATPAQIRQRVAAGLQQRRQALQQRQVLAQVDTLRHALNAFTGAANGDLSPPAEQRVIRAGKLTINRHHRTATFDNTPLELTTTEFDLLVCLVQASPQPLLPQQLVSCAMGYESSKAEARDIVKWHIYQLRRKIEPDPSTPQYIKTVRHKGYLWHGG